MKSPIIYQLKWNFQCSCNDEMEAQICYFIQQKFDMKEGYGCKLQTDKTFYIPNLEQAFPEVNSVSL